MMRVFLGFLVLFALFGIRSEVQAAETLEDAVPNEQNSSPLSWPPPVWTPDADKTASRDLKDMFLYLADEALTRGKPEIFAVHFRSMALVVDAYGEHAPEQVAALRDIYMKDWENGPAQWKTYVEGGNRRPLYFELHGKGKPTPLPNKTLGFVSRETGIGAASYWNEGFHVYPLNRDSAYMNVGEVDLWECLEIVDRHLRTDPRRQYIFGFSLGACGTFLFGASSMEERGWAAAAAYSPVIVHNTWVANQFRNTPVWIVYGDQEWPRMQRQLQRFGMKSFSEQLTEFGNPPEFELIPNTGHSYKGEYQKKMLTFLSSHVNETPALPEWKTTRIHAFGDDTLELYVNEAPILL